MFFTSRKSASYARLRKVNDSLQLKVMGLSDQVENFRKVAAKHQQEYEKLEKGIKKLSYVILNEEYVKSQLGGDNTIQGMNAHQLVEYIEKQYSKKRSEERNLLSELVDKLNQKEQEIESLKIQLSRLLAREQHMEEYGMNSTPSLQVAENEDSKEPAKTAEKSHPLSGSSGNVARVEIIENKNVKPVSPTEEKEPTSDKREDKDKTLKGDKSPVKAYKNMPQFLRDNLNKAESTATMAGADEEKPTNSTIEAKEESKSIEAVMNIKDQIEKQVSSQEQNALRAHVVNLHDYMNRMSNVMWDIMVAIGEKGLSEAKDIKKMVAGKDITESAINTALSQLRKMNIVTQERINTGWRWFHAYELSEIGKRIYLEKYKNNPVECEKQILKKQHTSALHGYCIKDTSVILKAIFGYDETITDRRENSIKLYNGETYIPDIIAKKKEGVLVDYFEVELGHHTQADFNKKCDKMLMVTKNLHFVVPDAETMNKVLARQIGQWVLDKGGKEKLKGTTIYLTTLKKLNDGKWDNIYPC